MSSILVLRRPVQVVRVDARWAPDSSAVTAAARRPRHQRHQRQHAPLAVVVGAHDEEQVLDRDDQRDRPEDQRQHAVDVDRERRHPVGQRHALLHRVERRGPDVAVDDADGAQRQLGEARAVRLGMMRGSGRDGLLGHEFSGLGRRSGMMNDLHSRSEIPLGHPAQPQSCPFQVSNRFRRDEFGAAAGRASPAGHIPSAKPAPTCR